MGASPSNGSSRMSAGCTTKSMPALRSSSWRRGDAEASTMEEGEDKRLRSQEDIVDEPRAPDKRGNRGQGLFSNHRLRLQRVRVDDFKIVEPDPRRADEFRIRGGNQRCRLTLTLIEPLAGPVQRSIEGQRCFTLVLIQVCVARAEGQTISFAHNRTDLDPNRHIQVANHAPDDRNLCGVFLSEKGEVGFHDVEQLGDNRGDAAKMSGT